MPRWLVVSPEYKTYEGGAYEPPEYGCDAIEIEADTKRDAMVLGVRELLKERRSYPSFNREDGLPPWAGMKVESSPPCDCCGEYEACRCKFDGEEPPYVCMTHARVHA